MVRLFNVKYLPLFHNFKAIYLFPKHMIFLIKIVANAPLRISSESTKMIEPKLHDHVQQRYLFHVFILIKNLK